MGASKSHKITQEVQLFKTYSLLSGPRLNVQSAELFYIKATGEELCFLHKISSGEKLWIETLTEKLTVRS
jgi:hypothetical protein